ncbi:hypothetical protein BLNAU_22533 [Blattamonas nauphoetae]|uniref:PPM-type phosphatase domain-containing protein n=1 Tax=Blattamonas nauphoetae TaxID=2049346 RepID=A0ABQ9WSS6_9EUKA|nr:hypothetical protein BLNAU_22533 [Blattamonas nauphoetae]
MNHHRSPKRRKSRHHHRSLSREPRNFPIDIPNVKSNPDFKAFFHDPSLVHRDIRSSTVDFTRQPKHLPSLNHPNVGCAETNGERQTMEDAVLLLPAGGWNLQTLLETGQVDRVERLLTFPQELRFSRIGLQEMSNIEFELEHAMHPPHPPFIPTLLRATMENLTKKMRLLRVDDGACALLALITPMTAFVTNVGDCRAVLPQTTHNTNILVPPWRFADVVSLFTDPPLTIDHKPVCQSERNFITSVGGILNVQRRINVVLAIARFEEGRTRLFSGLAELHDRHPRQRLKKGGRSHRPRLRRSVRLSPKRRGCRSGVRIDGRHGPDSVIQRARLIIEADDDNAYTALDEDSGSPPVDKGKFAKFEA